MTSAMATTTSAVTVVASTTSISLLRIERPGPIIVVRRQRLRTALARGTHRRCDGQQTRAQLQSALLGRVERDFETDAILQQQQVDRAAFIERAFEIGNEQDAALSRSRHD